jgi:hypothetical protein
VVVCASQSVFIFVKKRGGYFEIFRDVNREADGVVCRFSCECKKNLLPDGSETSFPDFYVAYINGEVYNLNFGSDANDTNRMYHGASLQFCEPELFEEFGKLMEAAMVDLPG